MPKDTRRSLDDGEGLVDSLGGGGGGGSNSSSSSSTSSISSSSSLAKADEEELLWSTVGQGNTTTVGIDSSKTKNSRGVRGEALRLVRASPIGRIIHFAVR